MKSMLAVVLIVLGSIVLVTSLSYTRSEINPITNVPRIEVPEIETSEIKLPIVGNAKITNTEESIDEKSNIVACSGSAICTTDKVIKIVDGDTIYTEKYKIRLALVNSPERYSSGFSEASLFTGSLCPVGSMISIDQDDKQKTDAYGRMVAKVTCSGMNLNEQILEAEHALITKSFCKKSEFSVETWAVKFGC